MTPLGKEISDQWPAYITTYGHTSRYDRLSALLAADKSITVDEAKAYATDTLVPYAEAVVKASRTRPEPRISAFKSPSPAYSSMHWSTFLSKSRRSNSTPSRCWGFFGQPGIG